MTTTFKVSLVAQEPVLYDESVLYNILYGCDASITKGRVLTVVPKRPRPCFRRRNRSREGGEHQRLRPEHNRRLRDEVRRKGRPNVGYVSSQQMAMINAQFRRSEATNRNCESLGQKVSRLLVRARRIRPSGEFSCPAKLSPRCRLAELCHRMSIRGLTGIVLGFGMGTKTSPIG